LLVEVATLLANTVVLLANADVLDAYDMLGYIKLLDETAKLLPKAATSNVFALIGYT
jgi:hypothetical protein